MEFASEIVIKATLQGMRITQVPIKLHKDGRDRPPHLRPWRDGWRHLRFMMCLSPRWTLLVPGVALMLLGLLAAAVLAFRPVFIAGVGFDVHTLVIASLCVLVGYQWTATALVMRVFGLSTEIGPPSDFVGKVTRSLTLERGLILGLVMCLAGLAPIGYVVVTWARAGFGALDASTTIRPMIVGSTIIALGVQTLLLSLMCAMFRMRRDARLPGGVLA
jgi:hypothetical protein